MIYKKVRQKILKVAPFIKIIRKYNIIIPKILAHIVWPIYKPKNCNYDGKKFFLSTKNYPNPSRDLFAYKNIYNSYEKKILEIYLTKGSNCIDVGANIGFFTYLFLKIGGKKSLIYSFESNSNVYSILKKNFENETNVICELGKVGTNEGDICIDNIINFDVNFIKIDIDGVDYYALKSCEQVIKKNKPKIIIELSEASEREHGIHYNKTIEFLLNNNYNLYEIKNKIEQFNRKLKYKEVINLFALHSSQKL
tara:strand:+ start:281 stop:1036 length:756 start_codon:yes stop_codon:yes gene_type:complete